MLRYILQIFLACLLFPAIALGQNKDTIRLGGKHKIEIGLNCSLNYCYRSLSTDGSAEANMVTTSRDTQEVAKYSFSIGTNAIYSISNRLSVTAGLSYIDLGNKSKSMNLTYGNQINPVRGFVYSSPSTGGAEDVSYTYHYTYLEIPVTCEYHKQVKNFDLFASLGIAGNIHLSDFNTMNLTYSNGTTTSSSQTVNDGTSSLNIAVLGGIGASYSVSKKIDVRLAPTYERFLNSIDQAPICEYIYAFKLNGGVYYKI